MNRTKNFNLLRKINSVKGLLLASELQPEAIIKLLTEFYIASASKDEEIADFKRQLENGNKIDLLNLLNNYKENISKLIFKNPCSKNWNHLVDTDHDNTKYCMDCKKNVYLVTTEAEFIKRRNLEQCVAINTHNTKIPQEHDKHYKACHLKFSEVEEFLGLPF